MKIKSAREIIQEIEATRQQIGSVSMVLDGAQVHYMFESMIESLKTIAELLSVSKETDPSNWNDAYGDQEDSLESAYELGLTAISTIKMFAAALPNNLRDFDEAITPEKLDFIESYFKKN